MAEEFERIRGEVVKSGGIKCFKMQTLREASVYKKLGPGVNKELSAALQQKNLGHTPMPVYQHEPVYVYEQGSQAAQLINAITGTPSENVAPSDKEDGASARLEEVRALAVQLNDVFAEAG